MTVALRQTWQINLRYLRAFVRQPAWVAIALVQPIIWLLLFGGLFKRVVEIPGFQGGSYIEFLTPGVAVLTAVMSAGWNGMGFIEDMRRGVLDRVLVAPMWRGALNAGSLLYAILTIALQVLIIIGIGLGAGASFANGVGGVAILVLVACLLGGSVAALSIDPGGHGCGRVALGHRVPSHPLRVWQRRIEVKGRQAADEVGQKPTGSCGCLGCVLRLKLAASDEPLRMHRDAVADDHVGQRHRTGKALLGEQSLRRNATARPT
jgi:ABC-2 type transporter